MRKYYQETAHPDSMLIVPDGEKPAVPFLGRQEEITVIGISIAGLFRPHRHSCLLKHFTEHCQELSEAQAVALYPDAATVSR